MTHDRRPMTATEKIIAAHSGQDVVKPGEIHTVKVDLAMANDITAPMVISAFREMGAETVFDREGVALVLSHFVPAKDIESAEQARLTREFARKQQIAHFFPPGEGIEHVLLPENGLVMPGDLVLGADSHTCTYGALGAMATGVGSTDLAYALATGQTWLRVPESVLLEFEGELNPWVTGKDLILHAIGSMTAGGATYRALEFTGPAIEKLSMADRFTMANMAVEAGAKNGIFTPDDTTEKYLRDRTERKFTPLDSDREAVYARRYHFDCGGIEPQVAMPHSPDNAVPIEQACGKRIDTVFLGSCTNGRYSDLQAAAAIISGRRVHPDVDMMVIPASRDIYARALSEGVLAIFTEAGATVSAPTCGPCLGGHMGVLAEGQRCLSTSNRNFPGRMGHTGSEVYLASPVVAAASAVTGEITHPGHLSGGPENTTERSTLS